jgi:hypothetical protein
MRAKNTTFPICLLAYTPLKVLQIYYIPSRCLASLDIRKLSVTIITVQQIIDERIFFLQEQINTTNKPEVNKTF